MKRYLLIVIVLGLVLAVFGIFTLGKSKRAINTPSEVETVTVKINDKTKLTTFIPTTLRSSSAGLAVFDEFDDRYAMLFRMPAGIEPALWMKDMKFAIDMVWLDSDDRIVFINHNVGYLDQETIYKAPEESPAKCVIELNAGASRKLGLEIGDQLKLVDRNEPVCQSASFLIN